MLPDCHRVEEDDCHWTMSDSGQLQDSQVKEFGDAPSTSSDKDHEAPMLSVDELNALVKQPNLSHEKALKSIGQVCKSVRKTQSNPGQLTQLHVTLCQLCLMTKCLKPALPFLDTEINKISRDNGSFDVKYFLLYYYYGGMIYAALKNWERALFFFEAALTPPSMAISMIMIEAYKKYVLVSLILHGKVLPLPKYTSSIVNRFNKSLSPPYKKLAQAYELHDSIEVSNIITKFSPAFSAVSNKKIFW